MGWQKMGWQIEKPVNLEEEALQFSPKALSLGCSLQYWGSVGSWSRGDANFSLVARAHFCRAVIMWGGVSVKLSFWSFGSLVCLEVITRNIFACDDEAYAFWCKTLGGGWMLSCKPLYFAFSKALWWMLRRSGVSLPLCCRCKLLCQCTLLGV